MWSEGVRKGVAWTQVEQCLDRCTDCGEKLGFLANFRLQNSRIPPHVSEIHQEPITCRWDVLITLFAPLPVAGKASDDTAS